MLSASSYSAGRQSALSFTISISSYKKENSKLPQNVLFSRQNCASRTYLLKSQIVATNDVENHSFCLVEVEQEGGVQDAIRL